MSEKKSCTVQLLGDNQGWLAQVSYDNASAVRKFDYNQLQEAVNWVAQVALEVNWPVLPWEVAVLRAPLYLPEAKINSYEKNPSINQQLRNSSDAQPGCGCGSSSSTGCCSEDPKVG